MGDSRSASAERTGANDENEGVSSNADPANLTARLWRELLEIDSRLQERKNIHLLTPEARILIHLMLNGPEPVTTVMQMSGISYRGFYSVLERLKQAELVAAVRDEQDHRVRRLNLDPSSPLSSVKP